MHLYQHGMDLSLVSQWLGHANLSTSLIYAYADTQHKRDAIEKAMGGEHSGITDTTLCTVDDDELLKVNVKASSENSQPAGSFGACRSVNPLHL